MQKQAKSQITIVYEDGREVTQMLDSDTSLLRLAGVGALDALIEANEPNRR